MKELQSNIASGDGGQLYKEKWTDIHKYEQGFNLFSPAFREFKWSMYLRVFFLK